MDYKDELGYARANETDSSATSDEALATRDLLDATPPPQAATPLPEQGEQALFEAWLGRPMMNPEQPSHYNGRDVRTSWGAWQASAALPRQAAPVAPASEQAQTFNGMSIVVDPTLPPGAMRLESGRHSVTLTGIAPAATTASASVERDTCAEMRALCPHCGGTGDVHSLDGEWRGSCNCKASEWARAPAPSREASDIPAQTGIKPWQERYAELAANLNTPPNEVRAERRKSACRDAEIADLRAALAQQSAEQATPSAEVDAEGLRADEATRLRRIVRALGMESEMPADDATLRACLFSVLGQIAYKLEARRAGSTTGDAGVGQDSPREWQAVTRAGQVKVGDKLRFKVGDSDCKTRAKQILHAGTDKEEVIYDKGRNFYFITSMVLSGSSNHKQVEVLAATQPPVGDAP